jgi:hypothetical protein
MVKKSPLTKQFTVSVEEAINATNTLVKKAQTVFKNIIKLDAFVNKEHWNII